MLISILAAVVYGVLHDQVGIRGVDSLSPWMAAVVPAEKHASFIADYYAHLASYSIGLLGGLVVLAIVLRSRIAAASPLT